MVIDYKDVAFSFKERKRKKHRRQLKLLLLLCIIIIAVFLIQNFQQHKKIKKIQTLLLTNNQQEAFELVQSMGSSLFQKKTITELKALICLFEGNYKKAHAFFEKIKKSKTRVFHQKFLNYFSDRAQYQKLEIYSDFLSTRGEDMIFYKALCQTAFFNFSESEKLLNQLSAEQKRDKQKEIQILNRMNAQLKTGKLYYIFDINGNPIAYFNPKNQKTVSLAPGFFFAEFTPYIKRGIKHYTLTLDLNAQKKISRIFKKYHGSMLLFKLDDNGIIAAFSKPQDRKQNNAVFTEEYEPGSIIKLLTLFTFYLNPVKDFFPLECNRSLFLNNRDFADRLAHGIIANPEKALIVSCNIAFAKMGLVIGFERLSKIFKNFYFNSNGIQDQFLKFKTGKFNEKISTDFQLANLSVGLNEISVTTFHSALIALVIAQNGSIYNPYIIKNIKTILNLGFYNHRPAITSIFSQNPAFLEITRAMTGVVEDADGTGKYAKVDYVHTAIKTGSAGNKKIGLDSIIIGFFPAEKPVYAFAFRLERAGKVELNGAAFLKEFLTLWYHQ